MIWVWIVVGSIFIGSFLFLRELYFAINDFGAESKWRENLKDMMRMKDCE